MVRALLPLLLIACPKTDTDADSGALTDSGSAVDTDETSPPTDTDTETDTDTTPADPCDPAVGVSTIEVSETQLGTAYPTPAGGTVMDGVYDLERFEVYAPATADGNQRANRIVIAGDLITSVLVDVDEGGAPEILGGTWASNGTELAIALTCPVVGAIVVPYTASGDELWIFDPSEPNLQVYVRQ